MAKGMEAFVPTSRPVSMDSVDDLYDIDLEARVNGIRLQYGNTKQMIFSIEKVIAFISQFLILEKGDIIATGTPKGIGPIVSGDTAEIEVFGVGKADNPVHFLCSVPKSFGPGVVDLRA